MEEDRLHRRVADRPDAAVLIGIAFLVLLLRSRRDFFRVMAYFVLGVSPWVAFCVAYYGSPIANTILAKSVGYNTGSEIQISCPSFPLFVLREFQEKIRSIATFSPSFRGHGLEALATIPYSNVTECGFLFLAGIGIVAIIHRRMYAIVAITIGHMLFLVVVVRIVFSWYTPGTVALGMLLPVLGLEFLFRRVKKKYTQWVISLAIGGMFVVPLWYTFPADCVIQKYIENGVRKQVGIWLAEHAKPTDYVTAECLGYLGYYSNLPFHDFPGLSSPKVVKVLREDGRDRFIEPIVEKLKPDWIVLRQRELADYKGYKIVHEVRLADEFRKELFRYLVLSTIDDHFYILKKIDQTKDAGN